MRNILLYLQSAHYASSVHRRGQISPCVEVWQSGHATEPWRLYSCTLVRDEEPPVTITMSSCWMEHAHLYLQQSGHPTSHSVSYARVKLDVEMALVADSTSVLKGLYSPPISRRPAGDLQLEWLSSWVCGDTRPPTQELVEWFF